MQDDDAAPPAPTVVRAPAAGQALLYAQVIKSGLRLVTAMLFARLLTPEDYGLFGMAVAVHGFYHVFRDLGASAALQRPDLTPAEFGGICRYAMAAGLICGVLCALTGPVAAAFYHEPALVKLTAALAVALTLSAFSSPLQTILYREERTHVAAWIDTASTGVGCLVGLACAMAQAGPWALVAMALSTEIIALVWILRASSGRLTWKGSRVAWRELFGFGLQVSAHGIFNYVARLIDQVIVGRTQGTTALGLYGRGVQLNALPMQFTVAPFTGWIIATLGRLQNDPPAYRAFFGRALNGLTHLTLPCAALCFAAPDVAVGVLFGQRWAEAAPIARWLSLGLAVQPWLFAGVWLLVSGQRARRLLWSSIALLGLYALGAFAGRHGGGEGIALGVGLASVLAVFVTLPLALTVSPISRADVGAASWRPLVLAIGLGMAAWAIAAWLPQTPGLVVGVTLGAATAGYAAVMLWAWPKARAEWREHFLWRA